MPFLLRVSNKFTLYVFRICHHVELYYICMNLKLNIIVMFNCIKYYYPFKHAAKLALHLGLL